MNDIENAKRYFEHGIRNFENGEYSNAEYNFKASLKHLPNRLSTLTNLLATLIKQNKDEEAKSIAEEIVFLNPSSIEARLWLGVICEKNQDYGGATTSFNKLLEIDPNNFDAYYKRGNIFSQTGKKELAIQDYSKALALKKESPAVLKRLIENYVDLNDYKSAEVACRKLIAIDPDSIEAWTDLGGILLFLERYAEAADVCQKVVQMNPTSAEAFINLGAVLIKLERYEPAENACRKAIELDSDSPMAWASLGGALAGLGRYEPAENACRRAVKLDSGSAIAWLNLGGALAGLGRYEQAENACRKAMELSPRSPPIWRNLAGTLRILKRFKEADEFYEMCLDISQNEISVLGELIHNRMEMCDWRDFETNTHLLMRKLEGGEIACSPFVVIVLSPDPAIQFKAAELYSSRKFPANSELGLIQKPKKRNKIRIGYYSADFHNHAMSYLMAGLYESHNKEHFELIGFSFGADKHDECRKRVSSAFDHFIDVRDYSDKRIAALSREMEIDVAVNLNGYTQDQRTGIFAYRAAPIQVNYLGYPGTMGAKYIDYIIADKTLIPAESEQYYSEKIVYLPNCYQANDDKRITPDKRFSREELGLPSTGFVFACFNNNNKITPSTFDSWMRILKQVDGSVLWLLEGNPYASQNLRREAELRGVASNRLIFAKRLTISDHLARVRMADLFLDTWPYNAHTTASDALWVGLPVLTFIGESFASRVAASLLKALDLPELIATSQKEYEILAVELATHLEKIQQIRLKLAQNRLTKPLFDTQQFTKDIEAAYQLMLDRYQMDMGPDNLYIDNKKLHY